MDDVIPVQKTGFLPHNRADDGGRSARFLGNFLQGNIIVCKMIADIGDNRRIGAGTCAAELFPARLAYVFHQCVGMQDKLGMIFGGDQTMDRLIIKLNAKAVGQRDQLVCELDIDLLHQQHGFIRLGNGCEEGAEGLDGHFAVAFSDGGQHVLNVGIVGNVGKIDAV